MSSNLKWIGNYPKKDIDEYLKQPGREKTVVGKCQDSGCYYGIQLDIMGLVGIYVEECEHEWDITSPIDTLEVCRKCGEERPCKSII